MLSELKNFVRSVAKIKVYCPHSKGVRDYDIARCSFVLGLYDVLVEQGKLITDEQRKTLGKCLNHYLELYGQTKASKVLIEDLAKNLRY